MGAGTVRARAARVKRRRRRALLLGIGVLAAGALALGCWPGGRGSSSLGAQATGAEPTAQTDASVPASRVTLIGASPQEAPAETWGIGEANVGGQGSQWVIVRYTETGGWSLGPGLLNAEGGPLSGFVPDKPIVSGSSATSPLAGQMTPAGAGVLIGTAPNAGHGAQQVLLLRNPGGAFTETPPVPNGQGGGETLLEPGEILFGAHRAPLIAPLMEAGSSPHAGALVVPVRESAGVEDGVLHFDGQKWTREPIEIPAASAGDFRVLAIGASSPENAWLLGQLSSKGYPAGAVALFRRQLGGAGGPSWQPVALRSGGTPGEPLSVAGATFTVPGTGEPPSVLSQVLTVTSEGVWVDGLRSDVSASTTLFFKPQGSADAGDVVASWCQIPAGAPAKTTPCTHELPEALPSGPSRSFAWANPSTPEGLGERVITGLGEGVSLRLEGTSFTRVLALGGSPGSDDVGGTFGAAFSNPREGWLGNHLLPVHLTMKPTASRLAPYPVPFRHALVAVAPAPDAPVGSLSSEALAVGDQGQVARYKPGQGWLPESLLSSGGRRAMPRLRAVAWPTPGRAYAVGDRGQMWLWRAETGLWEPDPATPFNFRGDLLSIAFDPSDPERGYAVGQEGVLLGYGKSWSQEKLPEGLANATFTSVAFAGSEAIVAYRLLPEPSTNHYLGGLLVNDGSGWRIDTEAAAAIGANVPWAVAGLPDGGAAFSAGEASGEGTGGVVYERQGPGAPWQQTATPFPGGLEPGSLALFREGGALRVVASGSVPNTYALEDEPAPPAGFPPNLIPPYPLSAGYGAGHVLRQTATGWSDEEHELNDVQEGPGNYAHYDMAYQPDPISAVLINEAGSEGWAVGGFVDTRDPNGALDTAEVARYPAEAGPPVGAGTAPIAANPGMASFAIGGGAQCASPCAARANARIGPDVWLSSALQKAAQISGVRAFLYTGPRVTTGQTAGPATQEIPYADELDRYAQVLGSGPLPAFAAPSPTDLDGGGTESLFEEAFAGFPEPFGRGASPGDLAPVGPRASQCAALAGCQQSYYAFESTGTGGSVRVIVLDDTGEVDADQLKWLQQELSEAAEHNQPAIVVGDADLHAQLASGEAAAEAVARALIDGGASAYFYYSPEQNVQLPLSIGGSTIPTFGSGTLGYVNYQAESQGDFLGASGFLLAQVNVAARNPHTNRAPVDVQLIPNVGELAIEAKSGTLLRRSQPALFDALARRPRAGNRSPDRETTPETDPYIQIPSNCVGIACANGIFPSYTFSSSRPDIGSFVVENLASAEPDAVLLGAGEKPVADEPRNAAGQLTPGGRFEENAKGQAVNENGEVVPSAQSALFCAYNPGTTIVTISAGGVSSSLPVTVRGGSVERPCGTVPSKDLRAGVAQVPSPPPAPSPAPSGAPAGASPLPPALVVPPLPPSSPASPTPSRALLLPPVYALPPHAFVPTPPPPAGRPAPPSTTSPSSVFQVEAAPKEETESESAIESVSNNAAAYDPAEHEPMPPYLLGVIVLAAFAGTSIGRGMRRGRRDLRVAPATITTLRAQRRMSRSRRGMR